MNKFGWNFRIRISPSVGPKIATQRALIDRVAPTRASCRFVISTLRTIKARIYTYICISNDRLLNCVLGGLLGVNLWSYFPKQNTNSSYVKSLSALARGRDNFYIFIYVWRPPKQQTIKPIALQQQPHFGNRHKIK